MLPDSGQWFEEKFSVCRDLVTVLLWLSHDSVAKIMRQLVSRVCICWA